MWRIEDIDFWEQDAYLVTPIGTKIYFQFPLGQDPTIGYALETLLREGKIEIFLTNKG